MTKPTTDTPDLDVLVAEARRAVHESLVLLPAWEADRVRSLIADLETAVEWRAAMRTAEESHVVADGSSDPAHTDDHPGREPDTLPEWLYQRFARYRRHAPTWGQLTDEDRSYWVHEAAAVRRAVARDGFKTTPARCGAVHHHYPETVCTEPPGHYRPDADPHAGPLVIDGRERGGAAWDEPVVPAGVPAANKDGNQ